MVEPCVCGIFIHNASLLCTRALSLLGAGAEWVLLNGILPRCPYLYGRALLVPDVERYATTPSPSCTSLHRTAPPYTSSFYFGGIRVAGSVAVHLTFMTLGTHSLFPHVACGLMHVMTRRVH